MQDQKYKLHITDWNKTVSLDVPPDEACAPVLPVPPGAVADVDDMAVNSSKSSAAQNLSSQSERFGEVFSGDGSSAAFLALQEKPRGCRHRHYLQMPQPYQGMWAASHGQLLAYINSR